MPLWSGGKQPKTRDRVPCRMRVGVLASPSDESLPDYRLLSRPNLSIRGARRHDRAELSEGNNTSWLTISQPKLVAAALGGFAKTR
jgi:hypothetical protein